VTSKCLNHILQSPRNFFQKVRSFVQSDIVEIDQGPEEVEQKEWFKVNITSYLGTHFVIYDYGGHTEFLLNHANYLSVPGSVYVILLPLWNIEEGENIQQMKS